MYIKADLILCAYLQRCIGIGTLGTNSPSHPNSPIMHSGGGSNSNLNNNNNIGGLSAGGIKSCAGCGGRIMDRFLLHAVDRYWHTGCLKCSCCQTKLADFSSCFTRSGMILCKNDYLSHVCKTSIIPVRNFEGCERVSMINLQGY
ncbi:hypothetical protein CHS0354_001553 [Potamilus streckersoni]|uniref:LIM zinc-binding domain-containing protein n=1 Tax=Potamilus streckersoni TaxID=2493646 RepID=A0AAE0SMC1_9BIVA|nr:hypothetical protein CHS0354_001553 [Potamilus streckersoni]